MKLHKFVNDYFHDGRIKYHAGLHYAPDAETAVAVAAGHAEEIDGDQAQASAPFEHPRTRAARKIQLQAIIGEEEARKARVVAAQKELSEIEEAEKAEAKAAAANSKADDKAQAAQDRADHRAEGKADRAAADRGR